MTDEQRKELERLVKIYGNLMFSGDYSMAADDARRALIAFVEKLCEQPKS